MFLETEETKKLEVEILQLIREKVAEEKSMTIWAKKHGVTCAFVSAILSRTKRPSNRILRTVGYEWIPRDSKKIKSGRIYRKI